VCWQELCQPPAWAWRWDDDAFGAWASFRIGDVEQRLRWIPPGRFYMGSPKEEEGRYDDEGPRHEVHISRGYWLFDTPCTQGLWQAVTIIRVGFRARIVRWRM
jgi:formylglycine-generating enzyme required for sulfatase activity